MTAQTAISAGLIGGVLAVLYGVALTFWVLAQPAGNERMREIAAAIQEGAMAFLQRQYRTIGIVAIVLAIVILFAPTLGREAAIGFLIGAILSGAAGFIGMIVSVRANVRTARSGTRRPRPGAQRRFPRWHRYRHARRRPGLARSLRLLRILMYVNDGDNATSLNAMVGLAFGCSLISVFARLGGGIYTKAADVGADLVGKVEAGIPEDDPRNPAVIADNVGDNVGDCAGMAADLFETYCVTTVAAMLLGNLLFGSKLPGATTFPLLLGAVSIVASIVGALFVGVGGVRRNKIMSALYRGMAVTGVLALVGFYFVTQWVFGGQSLVNSTGIFICAIIGVVITALITFITEYYTGSQFPPVQRIARASVTGHATNIIAGLAVSMQATALPALVIVVGLLISFGLDGVYGVGIAVTAMLSLAGIVVAIDAFGPITDNAGGIAEMADMPEDVRNVTDPLDAVGNTTKGRHERLRDRLGRPRGPRALRLVPPAAYQPQMRRGRDDCLYRRCPQPLRGRKSVRARRPLYRRSVALSLCVAFDGSRWPRRRRRGGRRAPSVPREPWHHGRHHATELRHDRRYRHARRTARNDRPGADSGRRSGHRWCCSPTLISCPVIPARR